MSLEKYEICLKRKKVNHSYAREAIYRIFLENTNTFMTISDIQNRLEESYPKKVSLNTIYRHLHLFVSCDLVLNIQDDNKKAYYINIDGELPLFELCSRCQRVDMIRDLTQKQQKSLADILDSSKGKKMPYMVIHRMCKRCS